MTPGASQRPKRRIRLPRPPDADQYHFAVTAALLARGYFTEWLLRHAVEGREVLELDVIGTPRGAGSEERVLVEAKTGKTGFADLFKVYGWMTYLGVSDAWIVRSRELEEQEGAAAARIGLATRIRSVVFDPNAWQTAGSLHSACVERSTSRERVLFWSGWYAQLADACCQRALAAARKKSEGELARIYGAVCDAQEAALQSFFAATAAERAEALRLAYEQAPRRVGQIVAALCQSRDIARIWDDYDNKGTLRPLQAVGAMEHRQRLWLIKAVAEYLAKPDSAAEAALRRALPGTFDKAARALGQMANPLIVPYGLQAYVELLGGFHVCSKDEEDLVASTTGLTKQQFAQAIDLLDVFFPCRNRWLLKWQMGDQTVRALGFVPAYLRGIGCFTRGSVRNTKDYACFGGAAPKMQEWHLAAFNILEDDAGLRVAGEAPATP